MLFNSYTFIFLFFPIVAALTLSVGRIGSLAGALVLLISSIVFYAWWSLDYLPLILGSIIFNYLTGRTIERFRRRGDVHLSRTALAVGVIVNILLIAYYKYFDFLASSAASLTGLPIPLLNVVLPIGISFYTFTQMAFLVDCSRGKVKEFGLVYYALFVTYFPHLIAGPILHHAQMIPQFKERLAYRPNADNISAGLLIFSIGLAKKVLLADSIAPIANQAFADAGSGAALGFTYSWLGVLAYTLQLYFDFSGYSDMAVGLARMLNVRLPINFNSPYQATSIVEFWTRWHMTLSAFLRDYLYIPLGGNRRGDVRRYVNIFLTMLIGGLWHGASWTFVVWGGLHGIFIVINHAWHRVRPDALAGKPLGGWGGCLLTFLCAMVAWVFFRAPDFASARRVLAAMAGAGGVDLGSPLLPASVSLATALPLLAAGLAIVLFIPNIYHWRGLRFDGTSVDVVPEASPWSVWLRPAIAGVLFAAAVMGMTGSTEFIYFNF